MEKFSVIPHLEIVVGEKSDIDEMFGDEILAKETEERLENLGFEIRRRNEEKSYSWIILTPSRRELTIDTLRKFYQGNDKLEFGNKEHIENLKALEYLEALTILYDDVNETVF